MRWWRMLTRETPEQQAQKQTHRAAEEAEENWQRLASLQARLAAAMAQHKETPPQREEGKHA